ncbi:MAG TPA: hypothetical protein VLM85_02435 [Polyangiaceae bacterium]|nr:hypothetical protein [Polyangiaceae bacterium]
MDSTEIHWLQVQGGLWHATKAPSQCFEGFADDGVHPLALISDSSGLYWLGQTSGGVFVQTGMWAPNTLWTGPGIPRVSFGTDSTDVFWLIDNNIERIAKVDMSGLATILTTPPSTSSFVVDVNAIFLATATQTDAYVWRMAKDGSSATKLTTNVFEARIVTQNSTAVYIVTDSGYALRRVEKADGAVSLLWQSTQPGIQTAVADDSYVYVATTSGIVRIPANGGTSTALVSSLGLFTGPIAIDDQSLYWADNGYLLRMTPK